MAHDVFISYSSRDKTIADAVCAALEARKIRCWIAPRDVLPGIPFPEALIDALNCSRIVVLVFSAGSNSSPQVMREVERAVNKGLPIIPFRIEDVPLSKAMEYFLSAPHWLDALTPPLEAHLQKLADTVQMLLAAGGEGGPPVATLEMEASEVSEPWGGARPLGWSRWAALLAVLAVLGGAAGTGLWLSGRLPARPAPTGAGLAPPVANSATQRTLIPAPTVGQNGPAFPAATQAPVATLAEPAIRILQKFKAPGESPRGLAWDGANLWVTAPAPVVLKLDEQGNTLAPAATPTLASRIGQAWAKLSSFPAPAANPMHVVRVGDSLWVIAAGHPDVYRLDLEGEIVSELEFSSPCAEAAWDGEALWCAGAGKRVVRVDLTSGQELSAFEGELDNIRGIAWDGSALWMIDVHGNLVRCDTSGRRLRRLAVPVQGWPVDLEWVGGELWVADVHGQVTRFDSAFVKIGSFSLADCGAGPFPYEVATYWDGESLWLADTNQSRILQCGPVG